MDTPLLTDADAEAYRRRRLRALRDHPDLFGRASGEAQRLEAMVSPAGERADGSGLERRALKLVDRDVDELDIVLPLDSGPEAGHATRRCRAGPPWRAANAPVPVARRRRGGLS